MHTSVYTMKEGVLYDLAGRTAHHDRRERTVNRMMDMYHADSEQSERVFDTAERLLSQVEPNLTLEKEVALEYLEWATDLHEIGLAVAHGGHQKLGAWLVENSDMPGFTRREQATLSFLIRNQRKAITPNNSDYGVTEDWVLVMILRLAILLNRGRVTSKPPKIEFKLKSNKFDVTVNADWLFEHPLTQFDLEREASYWSTVGIEFRLKDN
jgi:exopolyphosphatase/guanosine-5'-triphosphate,3'-diphosphate pyrophosphatase